MIVRRKQLPPRLQAPYRAFLAVLGEIEPAKAGLADVLPTTRLPGRPLRDALVEFRTRSITAQQLMPAWRCEELEQEWQACDRGLAEAVADADRLLKAAGDPVGFEGLLGTVEHLMDRLEPFAIAAERFRGHRRRGRRTD
jgi:hypothetical protein